MQLQSDSQSPQTKCAFWWTKTTLSTLYGASELLFAFTVNRNVEKMRRQRQAKNSCSLHLRRRDGRRALHFSEFQLYASNRRWNIFKKISKTRSVARPLCDSWASHLFSRHWRVSFRLKGAYQSALRSTVARCVFMLSATAPASSERVLVSKDSSGSSSNSNENSSRVMRAKPRWDDLSTRRRRLSSASISANDTLSNARHVICCLTKVTVES